MHFIKSNRTTFLKLCLLFIMFSVDSKLSVKEHLISYFYAMVLCYKLETLQLLRYPYTTHTQQRTNIATQINFVCHSRILTVHPMVPAIWCLPVCQRRTFQHIKTSQQMVLLTRLVLYQHPMTDINWCVALSKELRRWNIFFDLLEVSQRSSITG